jgi:hypothetical protein
MNSIIIGFSKPKKFKLFAWAIMKGYNIPYDHVYIKFHSDSYERDLIYQASGLAVNFMSVDIFNSINDVVQEFTFPITDDNKKAMVQFCIDNVGKPYGFKDILGLAWARVLELCGKKVNNPVNDGQNSWVCCELGAYVLETFVGKDIPEQLNDITPLDLYNYLSKNQ